MEFIAKFYSMKGNATKDIQGETARIRIRLSWMFGEPSCETTMNVYVYLWVEAADRQMVFSNS